MSEGYAAPPPPPGAPPARIRPATVTVASWLLVLVVVFAAVYLIASIAALPDFVDAFEEAFAGTESDDFATVAAWFTLIAGVVYLLVGIALAILAIFNNRGRNPARIVTWVVGGLGVCCGGLNLISTAVGSVTSNMGGGSDTPDAEEMERIFTEHLPGWLAPVTLTANLAGVLLVVAALLLLALPPSNEFFRKPEQPFEPPPGYPQPPPPSYPQVG